MAQLSVKDFGDLSLRVKRCKDTVVENFGDVHADLDIPMLRLSIRELETRIVAVCPYFSFAP